MHSPFAILSPRNLNTHQIDISSTNDSSNTFLISGGFIDNNDSRRDLMKYHNSKKFFVSSTSSLSSSLEGGNTANKCFHTNIITTTAITANLSVYPSDADLSVAPTAVRSNSTPMGKRKSPLAQSLLPQTPPRTTKTTTKISTSATTTSLTKNLSFNADNSSTPPRCIRERIRPNLTPTPSKSSSDRYIPNRAYLDVNICRDAIVSQEKKLRRSSSCNNNNTANEHAEDTTSTSSLTPLQLEYNLRMRGALLNVPFYNNLSSTAVTSSTSVNSNMISNDTSTHAVDGTTNSDPFRTVAVTDIDPAYSLATSSYSKENMTLSQSAISRERLLTFRSDTSPATAGMSTTTPTTATTPAATTSSSISPMRSNNHASIIPDPYLQDQLRVLNRTYGRKNITASTSPLDMIAMEEATLRSVAKKVGRKISTVPIRILDAPNLVDDYYLNLVSWSVDNILAVALGQSVYLWYAATEQIDHLLTLTGSDDYVTSVCWCNQEGNTNYIAVGTNDSTVQLWDASTLQKVRTLKGHSARVGSLAWNRQHWLSSGSRDSSIIQHDARAPQNRVATYIGHTQEVCGLKWSYDGSTLASGGNENFLCLWDAAMSSANMRNRQLSSSNHLNDFTTTVSARVTLTQHKAAVKALAWCPFHRGLLASGGGTADVRASII